MDPATATLLASAITAAGSVTGGYLSGAGSGKESKMDKTRRKLLDKLVDSLEGNGPFSDLYNTDEAAFQKSFVEPAQSRFRNQIAPQIQQEFIAGGQQRGTGLDDQLLRAGVDLDSLLNQHYMDFQNRGKDRLQSSINSIVGGGSGSPAGLSTSDRIQQATGGYLASQGFSDAVTGSLKQYQQQGPTNSGLPNAYDKPRKGFENDWQTVRNLPAGDPRWGQI